MADPVETNPLELSDAYFLNIVPPTGNSIQTEAPAAPAAGAEVVEEPAQIEEDPADDTLPAEPPARTEGQNPVDKPTGETDPKGDPAPASTKEEPKVGEDGKPVITTEGAIPSVGSKEPAAPAAKTGEAAPAGRPGPTCQRTDRAAATPSASSR